MLMNLFLLENTLSKVHFISFNKKEKTVAGQHVSLKSVLLIPKLGIYFFPRKLFLNYFAAKKEGITKSLGNY